MLFNHGLVYGEDYGGGSPDKRGALRDSVQNPFGSKVVSPLVLKKDTLLLEVDRQYIRRLAS